MVQRRGQDYHQWCETIIGGRSANIGRTITGGIYGNGRNSNWETLCGGKAIPG